MMRRAAQPVLYFGIHNTVEWWRCIAANSRLGGSVIVTDLRGEGDVALVDDFYRELRSRTQGSRAASTVFTDAERLDIIARCRSLRWLPPELAAGMVEAMAAVFDRMLEKVRPKLIISFPIDRYVMDVLDRRAAVRGIPYLELTASVFSGMSMFLHRGRLISRSSPHNADEVAARVAELSAPNFVPSYVPRSARYSTARFLRNYAYFRARAAAFWLIGRSRRDPLNSHYLDAQWFLGHKPRISDVRITRLIDRHWQRRVSAAPRERRVFFGLQLFPEASIDYWIENPEFVAHEECVLEAAAAFSAAGYIVLVKDHPLQFGFRRTDFVTRLKELSGVVIVPYEVPAQAILSLAETNFTFTGTLGLQAALAGLKSIVTPSYYTTEVDFVRLAVRSDLKELPSRIARTSYIPGGVALQERRERIVGHLLTGCFEGNLFSFKGYRRGKDDSSVRSLARGMDDTLVKLSEEGRL